MIEPLFQAKITCVCCDSQYLSSRVRPSFKKAIRTDTDFCMWYKEEVNPEYYVVRVCPMCGFSSTENAMQRLSERQKSFYYNKLGNSWVPRDYGGERTWEQAMESYKLALLCAQAVGEKDRVIAGLLHHIAWLYRYKDNKEQELRFLRFALEAYIKVYETEGESLNSARLMFLLGELHKRVDEPYEAVKWFARVVNDKRITDAGMIRASREQWQNLREDMLAKKMELPEEVEEA